MEKNRADYETKNKTNHKVKYPYFTIRN